MSPHRQSGRLLNQARRVRTVACTEFLMIVRARAFVLSSVMVPVVMVISLGFQIYAQRQLASQDSRLAVIDWSGSLFGPLAEAAAAHSARSRRQRVLPVEIDARSAPRTELLVTLSARVRAREFAGIVEIPGDVVQRDSAIRYYSSYPADLSVQAWLRATLREAIAQQRIKSAGVDERSVSKLARHVPLETSVLPHQRLGRPADARASRLAALLVPFILLFLMFTSVMVVAQHLVTAVVNEKMTKISEVLVASVEPFVLMLGKLLGAAAVAVFLGSSYLLCGVGVALQAGHAEWVRWDVVAWFPVFLACASLIFGAIFLALGSACSTPREAQALMQPAVVLIVLPYVTSLLTVAAPASGLVKVLAWFPTVTPFVAVMRMSTAAGPDVPETVLTVAVVLAWTSAFVWAAGRIFRVGILMQGKPATLPELLKWVRT